MCARCGGLSFQSEFSAQASRPAMEERNWGSFETLHLDWEIFHVVRQMQSLSERERWCGVTRPCLDLIVRHLSFPQSKHRVYPLLSRYLQVVFGFDVFEHDAEFNIVILKWMFLLDRLASESQPISFPVANHLLYGDDQWLPGREQRKCLLPPWELLPRDFLFDHDIPLGSLDVEFRVKEIESFLESFVKDEIEDERFDFLPLLLGWILCPNTRGWHDYEWGAPHPDSGEARTARLWQVLVHLQKIVHRNRVPSSGCAADDSLEIIKWASSLHDLTSSHWDRGSESWFEFLGVPQI